MITCIMGRIGKPVNREVRGWRRTEASARKNLIRKGTIFYRLTQSIRRVSLENKGDSYRRKRIEWLPNIRETDRKNTWRTWKPKFRKWKDRLSPSCAANAEHPFPIIRPVKKNTIRKAKSMTQWLAQPLLSFKEAESIYWNRKEILRNYLSQGRTLGVIWNGETSESTSVYSWLYFRLLYFPIQLRQPRASSALSDQCLEYWPKTEAPAQMELKRTLKLRRL